MRLRSSDTCHSVPCQYHGWGMLGRQAGLGASTMPRAQNRTAKGSTLMENETLCPSGYILYLWLQSSKFLWKHCQQLRGSENFQMLKLLQLGKQQKHLQILFCLILSALLKCPRSHCHVFLVYVNTLSLYSQWLLWHSAHVVYDYAMLTPCPLIVNDYTVIMSATKPRNSTNRLTCNFLNKLNCYFYHNFDICKK